ncbi:MAG: bifunctional oligoribonuclease/PAP phosphatase NrnA, partial [Victivallales bacterium]|nr:bifunctional oligoribonuclease/PAP phosphatase NrnA [Victivallales bacterium]
ERDNPVDIAQASAAIKNSDNFLVVTHQNPDGDAMGSAFGMLTALRDNGKKAEAFFHERLPEAYSALPIPKHITEKLPFLDSFDTIICLDFSNPKRFGDIDFSIRNSINIDHHPDNSCFATRNFVFPNAAATAEIIFNLLKGIPGWRISKDTATFLLTGLIMDTGGFRFDNTSSQSLRCAAELLEAGADYPTIIKSMFLSKSANFARMEADLVLNNLKTGCNGLFAWLFLSDSILAKYSVNEKDTEGLIDIIRAIKDFELVAIVRRIEEGFRFSMRSKNRKYSAGRIARTLNGGGHEMAAGGLINAQTLDEAEKILLEHVADELAR